MLVLEGRMIDLSDDRLESGRIDGLQPGEYTISIKSYNKGESYYIQDNVEIIDVFYSANNLCQLILVRHLEDSSYSIYYYSSINDCWIPALESLQSESESADDYTTDELLGSMIRLDEEVADRLAKFITDHKSEFRLD